MTNILKDLFDYQIFAGNDKLSALINETGRKYMSTGIPLSDDDMDLVSAAGDLDSFDPLRQEDKKK